MAIDYDRIAAEYEASLVTKLRGHGAGSFLEHWVPDPDPALGILNMIEAAWIDGRDELDLVVGHATLAGPALQKLRDVAALVAELKVDEGPDGYALKIRRMTRDNGAKRTIRPAGVRAEATRSRTQALSHEVTWGIHPSLAVALEAETMEFRNEGELAKAPGLVCVEARSAPGTVSFAVGEKDGLIKQARHSAVKAKVRRRVLELMCRAIEERTVQDASDHAAIYVVHQLQGRAGRRSSEGIVLPANAGLEVVAALRMVRDACKAFEFKTGRHDTENFFETAPGRAWDAAGQEEKLRRAVEGIEKFCAASGLPANSMKAVRVEKDVHGYEIRIIVQVSDKLAADRVPSTLRRLERLLKLNFDPVLQVYLEPWKDLSVLRRL
jgi:hypothetical protein